VALQPTSVTRKDLGRGIDSLSPKGSIPEGFSEDLANVDTSVSGQLTTRPGYEGHYGWLPLRVARATMTDASTLKLEFANAVTIDLTTTHVGPLVVAGRTSAAHTGSFGDFDTTSAAAVWYDTFALSATVQFAAGSGTVTQTSSQHGFSDTDFWVGAAEITAPFTTSNVAIMSDDVQVDTADYTATLGYTVATDTSGFLFYRDQTATAGTKYSASIGVGAAHGCTETAATDVITCLLGHGFSVGDIVAFGLGGGTALATPLNATTEYYVNSVIDANNFTVSTTPDGPTLDITAAGTGTRNVRRIGRYISTSEHGLDTFNILHKTYDTTTVSGKAVEVDPYDVRITDAGDVVFLFSDPAVRYSATYTMYLEAVPASQVKSTTATVTGGGPTLNTITISEPGSPYLFFNVYRYNSAAGQWESVIVDSWAYDEPTDTVTIDYYLTGSTAELVEAYWTTGIVVANAITVTHSGSVGTDTAPELTVWGIDHAGIYSNTTARGGHVTHLDAYKRVGERRLVAGVGGNLFRALSYDEGADDWAMGSVVANLSGRVASDVLLAPLFHSTDPGSVRTRGVVYDSSVVDNQALVTAATYVSAGVTDYTLTFAGKTGAIATGGVLSTSDYLTVSGMANPAHNGTWAITSVQSDSTTQTVIRTAHPAAKSSIDETSSRGRAGVFTDTFTLDATPNWRVGDRVLGSTISTLDLTCSVLAAASATVYIDGVTESLQLANGEALGVRRTTQAVPVADPNGTAVTTGFVRGDMVAVSGAGALDRRPRVLTVQSQADQTATITGNSTSATVTVGAAHRLNVGDIAVFYGALGGEYSVVSTPTDLTFTVAGIDVAGISGTVKLQGCVLQLDEAVTVEDSPVGTTTLTVDGRWIPLEAPYTTYDLPADTYYRYLDAAGVDDQAALRSTIIQDSMYFTNQADEVLKFDGTYLCRAGLPRWQPGLFATNDTAATAKLAIGASVGYTAKSDSGLYFVTATAAFAPGDWIYESTANATWQVVKVVTVPGDPGASPATPDTYQVTVRPSDDISSAGSTGTLQKVLNYKYYFKLNLIDRNQVIVTSYAAQSEDFVVQYSSTGQLKVRLAAPPAFGPYDYDRMELEVYRTEGDGTLAYLQSRQPVDFDRANPYIDVNDATSDTTLTAQGAANRDIVMARLLGNELGTGWEPPPRASTITSLDNRLLLGNIKSYPETSLTFKAAPGQTGLAAANLANLIVTLRKDSSNASTTTDMVNVARYEFRNSGAVTITPATDLARTATTMTVTKAAHGLAVGNWVYLFQSTAAVGKLLQAAGWWQIASVTTDTFTLTVNNAWSFGATDCDRYVSASTPTDIPVWLGTDGNYGQRDGNPASSSDVSIQAPARLAQAINATMRATTVDLGASAWLTAFAGQDQGTGRVKIVSPSIFDTTPGVAVTTPASSVKVYADGVDFANDSYSKALVTRVFPSRLVRSYPNYPDLFDNCFAADQIDSDSIIDVNPADGQEITAIIPFFGEGAGASSQAALAQMAVVVKEQSIWVVNVETREKTYIDSRGMGGTAPRAVCVTQRGVVFVNESGVYRLNRDLSVSPIGLNMTGKVKANLNKSQIAEAHAHHWAQGRRVKVSVPVDGETYPTEVWVYDYEREGKGQEFGAWTRYTDMPAVGWANLDAEAYWASTEGDVFLVRQRGDASDYRDEADAVAEAVITLRAEDFGVPGTRKVHQSVITEVELPDTDLTDLTVQTAMNLARTFETEGSPVSLASDDFQQRTFRTSLGQRRGNRISVRYRHQTKDEALNLTGVTFVVAPLSAKLLPEQANQT
jgi:hypothetical protein